MSQFLHLKNGANITVLSKLYKILEMEYMWRNLAYSGRHQEKFVKPRLMLNQKKSKVKYYILITKTWDAYVSMWKTSKLSFKYKMTLGPCREFSKYLKDI